MNIVKTSIDGVLLVQGKPVVDQRGLFTRLFCSRDMQAVLEGRTIKQINHSVTKQKGTVRGMHYQRKPFCEMKLVRCIGGRVWDVFLDLRAGSKTFLRWQSVELSPEACIMAVIPEGVAHGFQALENDSEMLYIHSEYYEPAAECGIRPNDPTTNIAWPLPIAGLSVRDANHPILDSATFSGL